MTSITIKILLNWNNFPTIFGTDYKDNFIRLRYYIQLKFYKLYQNLNNLYIFQDFMNYLILCKVTNFKKVFQSF